jgi:hypothetical protein
VQADEAGALLLRRGMGNDEIIARHEINLLAEPPKLALTTIRRNFGIFEKVEYPHAFHHKEPDI